MSKKNKGSVPEAAKKQKPVVSVPSPKPADLKFPLVPESGVGQAKFWCVSDRTIRNWRDDGAPIRDVPAMIEWLALRDYVDPKVQQRIDELTVMAQNFDAGKPVDRTEGKEDPDAVDQTWTSFEKLGGSGELKKALENLEEQRDYAVFRFKLAAKKNHKGDMKFFNDMVVKTEGAIHDCQLRAKKLGVDQGDLFPRKEAERIARAIVYWLVRSVDELEAEICPKLAAASAGGSIHREDVRKIVEGPMLCTRVLQPFARAAQLQARMALPGWFVDAMREALAHTLENGAARFDEVVAKAA